jgi:hypothetical protein
MPPTNSGRSGVWAPTARRTTPVDGQHAAGVHEQLLHAYLLGDLHVMFVFDGLSLGQRPHLALAVPEQTVGTHGAS